jgi:hypothetical protein
VTGLTGVPGRQVRYAYPQTLEQALQTFLSVQEAERQEKFSESFYANFDRSVRLTSKSPARAYSDDEEPRRCSRSRTVSGPRSQGNGTSSSAGKSGTPGTRNSRTKEAIRCYECDGIGHFARECPTQLKREANPSKQPEKRNPTERSKCPGSSSGKPPPASNRSFQNETRNQGNWKVA